MRWETKIPISLICAGTVANFLQHTPPGSLIPDIQTYTSLQSFCGGKMHEQRKNKKERNNQEQTVYIMCTHVYIYICIYIYICTYNIYIYICIYTYICARVYIYIWRYKFLHVHMYIDTYTSANSSGNEFMESLGQKVGT